jgi:hypothetical protein
MTTVMKGLITISAAVLLAACSKREPEYTVDFLAANPDRLKDIAAQCKLDRAQVGEATCNAAALAQRKRFMGDGKAKYTPSAPSSAPASPAASSGG